MEEGFAADEKGKTMSDAWRNGCVGGKLNINRLQYLYSSGPEANMKLTTHQRDVYGSFWKTEQREDNSVYWNPSQRLRCPFLGRIWPSGVIVEVKEEIKGIEVRMDASVPLRPKLSSEIGRHWGKTRSRLPRGRRH